MIDSSRICERTDRVFTCSFRLFDPWLVGQFQTLVGYFFFGFRLEVTCIPFFLFLTPPLLVCGREFILYFFNLLSKKPTYSFNIGIRREREKEKRKWKPLKASRATCVRVSRNSSS